ncbi:MAG TPA: type VII secretion protein EccE, partial [Mycobacterium sp.]|nr:type VII secretion protein EccE [Mycobacterium sp.]
MSMNRPTLLWPGPARLTLVLLAVIPAAMAYPWPSTRDRWLLGIAVAVAIGLLGWWRGLHFTTMLRRRLAMLGGNRAKGSPTEPADRTTAVLTIAAVEDGDGSLPLPLIIDYLDRYGIRADSIQITSCDGGSGEVPRQTWVGLTVSAADNLPALQGRSSSIPLHETARVAARRLADQLREAGWEAGVLPPNEVPQLIESKSRETWRAVIDRSGDHLAAYRISVDAALQQTLREVWLQIAQEIWTTVQITGTPT